MLSQAHIYIKGDVIGIGFRAWLKIHAKMNTVVGWARDAHDKEDIFGRGGGVEAMLQGEQEDVERMIALIEEGPPVARVDDTEVFWQEPKEIFETFEIRK